MAVGPWEDGGPWSSQGGVGVLGLLTSEALGNRGPGGAGL